MQRKIPYPFSLPNLRAARHAKDHRLNTWLFNRRLSAEWVYRTSSSYLFGYTLDRKFIYRLPKMTRGEEGDYICFCDLCVWRLTKGKMADPNRDQRNLKEETTDLWLKKRRAQQLILRKDHHLFEFYFILNESGRWKKE